jgi:hypothetical protein
MHAVETHLSEEATHRDKGSDESASRPPCGFWCLNDKIIKELMKLS